MTHDIKLNRVRVIPKVSLNYERLVMSFTMLLSSIQSPSALQVAPKPSNYDAMKWRHLTLVLKVMPI